MSDTKSWTLAFASSGRNLTQTSPPSSSNPKRASGVIECEYLKSGVSIPGAVESAFMEK